MFYTHIIQISYTPNNQKPRSIAITFTDHHPHSSSLLAAFASFLAPFMLFLGLPL
jgi:hypothetical protein